jgi:pyridoxine/pyridoxamine 5'-phosphate oxidase
LPEPLPDTPLPLVEAWLAEAQQAMRDATSMTLATVDPDGRPSARMVICRGFDTTAGWFVFYTDRDSRKPRRKRIRAPPLYSTGTASSARSGSRARDGRARRLRLTNTS